MLKKDRLLNVINELREIRLCGPSDDLDRQTAVICEYQYLLEMLKHLAIPLLSQNQASFLKAIEIEHQNIFSVYQANGKVSALLDDIEDLLEQTGSESFFVQTSDWIFEPSLITKIVDKKPKVQYFVFLGYMCKEINFCYSYNQIVSTILMTRALLNYVPPIFDCKTFSEVVEKMGKSLKEIFTHLEKGLRKIADFHTHRVVGQEDYYPSRAQIEPFKPQLELLLQQILSREEKKLKKKQL